MCNVYDTVRLILIALCLGGCTNQGVPGDWIGASFAELKNGFGAPEAVLINERNNRVYVFRDIPQAEPTKTKMTFGDGEIVMPNAHCAILFELAADVVTRWSWYQPGCQDFLFPMRSTNQPH